MSEVKVNKLSPRSGTTVTLGDSGDTISIPSGVTFSNAGTNTFASATITGDLTVDTNTLKVDSTNNRVGIGTSSPDAILHIYDAGASTSTHSYTKLHIENDDHSALQFSGSTNGEQWIWFSDDTTATPVGGITYYHGGPYMGFRVQGSERMRIDSSGNVGIGTSSPNFTLQLDSKRADATFDANNLDTWADFKIQGQTASGNARGIYFDFDSDTGNDRGAGIVGISGDATGGVGSLGFITTEGNSSAERMRITSSGVVGIGAVPPSGTSSSSYAQLQVGNSFVSDSEGTNSSFQLLQNAYVGSGNNNYATVGSGTSHSNRIMMTSGVISFARAYPVTANSQITYNESMRIDSSGNVLVGKTTDNFADVGVVLATSQSNAFTRNDGNVMAIRRDTSSGDLIKLYKGTENFFDIGSDGSEPDPYLNARNNQLQFRINGTRLVELDPNAFYPSTDNVTDLGYLSNRYDNIYASNGTIQTSDQNEKQSIQSLTTAEMNVAKRLSPLIKTFKWNSSVEEKGDNARTHTGIIAQDVQQAFTDEGLDAGNYALFCSDTWWEKEISVDAVAEEVDENGNVITEAKDAYTYIDTKEEATNGYTEKTRLGVRYPELLSFIQAYNDQRFTELEARITQLENA
jgi:hypothetical protein